LRHCRAPGRGLRSPWRRPIPREQAVAVNASQGHRDSPPLLPQRPPRPVPSRQRPDAQFPERVSLSRSLALSLTRVCGS